jgi:serine protease Do
MLMLSRSSAIMISLSSLGVGIILGFMLSRGGPAVLAQVPPVEQDAYRKSTVRVRTRTVSDQNQTVDELYDALAKQYDQFEHVNRTFELVAKAVSPALVHIIAHKTSRRDDGRPPRHFEETGSGVIVRCDSAPGLYVLTNHHVVEGARADKVKLTLGDGRRILPVRIWSDLKADIAVLKLDRDDLSAARLGDSDQAAVGSWVMALGSPFGLTHSVSQGIISARGRHLEELADVENQDFLQTDAAINPGNSGGPLVNMKGEVIGINNSIASSGRGNEGVGFTIPINLARWIMNQLITNGRVTRGALGIDLHREFRAEDAIALGMERPRGAWIDGVRESSPAAQAGLHDGDVVIRFKGVDIADLNHLINLVSMAPIGLPVEVVVWRERREHKFQVTVGDRDRTWLEVPSPRNADNDPAALVRRPSRPDTISSFVLGLELATLTAQLAHKIDLPDDRQGALVLAVDPESPLAGIVAPNDVISAIDNRAIQSADQVAKLLGQRTDHVQSVMSVDRLVKGELERHTIRVP